MAPASAGERGWRDRVSLVARELMRGREPLTVPVALVLEFYSLRPKGHLRSNGEVKPNAQRRPTAKPDFDKLARSVADALNGICYRDDAYVVEAVIRKRYTRPDQPYCGVAITVGEWQGED